MKYLLILIVGAVLASCSVSEDSGGTTGESDLCHELAIQDSYLIKMKSGDVHSVQLGKNEVAVFLNDKQATIEIFEPLYKIMSTSFIESNEPDLAIKPHYSVLEPAGEGIKIGVVDSGVDIQHKNLHRAIDINRAEKWGRDGVDDDNNGYVDDVWGWNFVNDSPSIFDEVGHGTHIAGIIAAQPSENLSGVAPKAKLIVADFMDAAGGTTEHAYRSIQYVINRGAEIINASWGTPLCSKVLLSAFEEWNSMGILFVISAGNANKNIDLNPEYPASFNLSNKLTIGSVGDAGRLSRFSNYGSKIDLYAPGERILSTLPRYLAPAGVGRMSGTSMSAAYVTAGGALIKGMNRNLSPLQIVEILVASSDLIGGRPVINLRRAIESVPTH